MQIHSLLSSHGFSYTDLQVDFVPSRVRRLSAYLAFLFKHGTATPWPSRDAINGICNTSQAFAAARAGSGGYSLFCWEATTDLAAPLIAQSLGLSVIALPQNLEAFVSNCKPPHATKAAAIEAELDAFRLADSIFCISREEQWFLRNRGIEADYLPYFPVPEVCGGLLALRSGRRPGGQKRFLVLGTASNAPTRVGMMQQLSWLSEIRRGDEFKVDVAGYGTEVLQADGYHPDFLVHGAVSASQLAAFIQGATAILVHQMSGTGALTRIPEMLLAGVPVIASSHAARSAGHYQGVYSYDNLDELQVLLRNSPLPAPPAPSADKCAERRFVSKVRELVDSKAGRLHPPA